MVPIYGTSIPEIDTTLFLFLQLKKIACKYVSRILTLVSMAYKMKPNRGFLEEFSWKYMHTYQFVMTLDLWL